MEVRNVKASDYSKIISLWNQELQDYPIDFKQLSNVLLCDENYNPNYIFVAYEADELIGFCIGIKRSYPYMDKGLQAKQSWILNIVVKHTFQRKGIGSKLLTKTEEALNTDIIILSTYSPNYFFSGVDELNEAANHFFVHHGYHVSEKAYSMKKDLINYRIPDDIGKRIKQSEYTIESFSWEDSMDLIAFLKTNFSVGWLKHIVQAMRDLTIVDTVLLAKKNGKIAGYVQYGIGHDLTRFGPFGVAEEHRNQGLGTLLIHSMWQKMKDNQIHYAWFHSTDEPGKRFYERNGMKVIKVLNHYHKHKKWKIGIVSTGAMADKMMNVLTSIANVEVSCVYSRSFDKGMMFAKKHHIANVYTNLEEMLVQPIDIIYIASINHAHFNQVKLCIEHKKHIICEKPLTLHYKDTELLFALAKKHHVYLFEAMSVMYMPNYIKLQEVLQDKNVHMIRSDLCQYSTKYDALKAGEYVTLFDSNIGGGALYDLGIYCISFMVGLYGKPDKVEFISNTNTSGAILLKYPSLNAVLTYGKDCHGKQETIISCEDGYYEISGPCSRCIELIWHGLNGTETLTISTNEKHHIYEMEAFIKMINEKDDTNYEKMKRISLDVAMILEGLHESK